MMALKLSKIVDNLELLVGYIVWPASIFYSLYCYFCFIPVVSPYLDKSDVVKGWFNGRNQDVADLEWIVLRQFLLKFYYLLIIHTISSQLFQIYRPKSLSLVLTLVGMYSVCHILSLTALLIFLVHVGIVYMLHKYFHRMFSYLYFVFLLMFVCYPVMNTVNEYLFDQDQFRHFLFDVSLVWLAARSLSFANDRLKQIENMHKNYLHKHTDVSVDFEFLERIPPLDEEEFLGLFAYSFYLPTFFTGPIIQYVTFTKNLKALSKWSLYHTLCNTVLLFKYIFYAFVLEVALHYFYTYSLQYYPTLILQFDHWALAGFGYSLTILFYLKYLFIFGFVQILARFDQIHAPEVPKCTSRLHKATLLWRHFDRGLYLWLRKYFYKPIINNNWSLANKLCATFICFTNVCLWHRMEDAAIVWCIINFIMISSEQAIIKYFDIPDNKRKLQRIPSFLRDRLIRTISAILFAITIVSNIYFLSNIEIGNYFFKRMILSAPYPLFPLLLVMYCGCLVCEYQQSKEVDKVTIEEDPDEETKSDDSYRSKNG